MFSEVGRRPSQTLFAGRWLALIALAIAMGVLTSTAVAWACATRASLLGVNQRNRRAAVRVPGYEDKGWRFSPTGDYRFGFGVRSTFSIVEEREWLPEVGFNMPAPILDELQSWEAFEVKQLIDRSLAGLDVSGVREREQQRIKAINERLIAKHASSNNPPALLNEDPWNGGLAFLSLTRGRLAAGWPVYCLTAEFDIVPNRAIAGLSWTTLGGFLVWSSDQPNNIRVSQYSPVIWPYRPYWPGLICNSMLYAIPWLVFFAAIAPLRRVRRRRAGLCERCRYDLRGLIKDATCPECGYQRSLRAS